MPRSRSSYRLLSLSRRVVGEDLGKGLCALVRLIAGPLGVLLPAESQLAHGSAGMPGERISQKLGLGLPLSAGPGRACLVHALGILHEFGRPGSGLSEVVYPAESPTCCGHLHSGVPTLFSDLAVLVPLAGVSVVEPTTVEVKPQEVVHGLDAPLGGHELGLLGSNDAGDLVLTLLVGGGRGQRFDQDADLRLVHCLPLLCVGVVSFLTALAAARCIGQNAAPAVEVGLVVRLDELGVGLRCPAAAGRNSGPGAGRTLAVAGYRTRSRLRARLLEGSPEATLRVYLPDRRRFDPTERRQTCWWHRVN